MARVLLFGNYPLRLFDNSPLRFSRAFPMCLLGAHVGTIDVVKTM